MTIIKTAFLAWLGFTVGPVILAVIAATIYISIAVIYNRRNKK